MIKTKTFSRSEAPRKAKLPVVDLNEMLDSEVPLPVVDYNTFESTMSWEEVNRILDEARMHDDLDTYMKITSPIPMLPHVALGMVAEGLLTGHEPDVNYADAEALFGKDWVEKYGPKNNRIAWKTNRTKRQLPARTRTRSH